jgi:hypothetical protein
MKNTVVLAAFIFLGLSNIASAQNVLFIGNSFTYGANSALIHYRSSTVDDLNGSNFRGENIGGVPALFKLFTDEAGLHYSVSLETSGGQGLDFHYQKKLPLLDHAWDDVVMQSYSTLDQKNPGDPALLTRYVKLLSDTFHTRSLGVKVFLDATWSRPDLTFKPGQHWSDQPISLMAKDLNAGYELAAKNANTAGVISVGLAFNRAIATDIAASNPYDGIPFGKIDLWSFDNYHASSYGYYLEALMMFGRITGLDPLTLGPRERAIEDLGLWPTAAAALQKVAHDELVEEGFSFNPENETTRLPTMPTIPGSRTPTGTNTPLEAK